MTPSLSVDSASHLLTASNVIYVVGAVLTLTSAGMVLYEKSLKSKGMEVRWGTLTEIVVIVAAFISLAGTIGAIEFGGVVSHLKDVNLETYKTQARVEIAQAEKDAALAKSNAAQAIQGAGVANQNAQDARLKADKTENDNSKLRVEVANHETSEAKANTELAAQTEKVNQYAQGVAQQQQGMAHQMQVTPSMNDLQIQTLASQLRGFAGSKISVHTMLDARSQRFAQQLIQAFKLAGLIVAGNSTDVGPNYTGVMIGVHDASPAPHPPLADAIGNALRGMGMPTQGTAYEEVPAGEVWILIGPQ